MPTPSPEVTQLCLSLISPTMCPSPRDRRFWDKPLRTGQGVLCCFVLFCFVFSGKTFYPPQTCTRKRCLLSLLYHRTQAFQKHWRKSISSLRVTEPSSISVLQDLCTWSPQPKFYFSNLLKFDLISSYLLVLWFWFLPKFCKRQDSLSNPSFLVGEVLSFLGFQSTCYPAI